MLRLIRGEITEAREADKPIDLIRVTAHGALKGSPVTVVERVPAVVRYDPADLRPEVDLDDLRVPGEMDQRQLRIHPDDWYDLMTDDEIPFTGFKPGDKVERMFNIPVERE